MTERTAFWLAGVGLAIAFDLLFWEHDHGVNVPFFTFLCLAGGLLALHQGGYRPAGSAFVLLAPLAFFAFGSFWRLEPLAHVVCCLWVLLLMALFAVSYRHPRWWNMTFRELAHRALSLGATTLLHGLLAKKNDHHQEGPKPAAARARVAPVLRGLLLALPVAGLFALLLARADSVFAHFLTQWISFRSLAELVFRAAYILVGAYFLVGVFTFAARENTPTEERIPFVPAWSKPLGPPEACVVLATVAALVAAFVLVQLRYFFGGEGDLEALGLTYAEYARRGFAELLAVAFLSLLLILALQMATREEPGLSLQAFRGLSLLLVVLVGVILVSAFQRLGLYQAAYGFTRARLYAHTVMVWIGLALVTVAILQLRTLARWLWHGLLLVALGFSTHLVLANVDGAVVRKNVARSAANQTLDVAYLATLSFDAIPTMAEALRDPSLPETVREAVGAALVCWSWRHRSWDTPVAWQEFHLSRWRAQKALRETLPSLVNLQVEKTPQGTVIRSPSQQVFRCAGTQRGP